MSRAKGAIAEQKACDYLVQRGFCIVARNVCFKGGELDIIAQKEGVVHFVEVKSGKGFDPIYNITPIKLARLIKSAQRYLQKYAIDAPWQIDAMIVRPQAIEWIENVTI